MSFVPLRLIILYDDARAYCGRVVPEMKQMLEDRAFIVDIHRIQDGPVDVSGYRGMVLGSPVFGLGLNGVGPTQELTEYVQQLGDLDELSIANFCVYVTRPGTTLARMKGLVLETGAAFVAQQGFWLHQPHQNGHVIPTECMVRIR